MQRTSQDAARFYEQVRSAHLERAHQFAPAAIVYSETRYDFDATLADGLELIRAGRIAAPLVVLGSRRLRRIEVNEPLYLESLPRTALVVAAARLRSVLGRRPIRISCYAIENLDRFALPAPTWRRRLRRRGERWLARFVWRRLDRVAFGTDGAESVYLARLGPARRTRNVPALPAPVTPTHDTEPGMVLFLGALTARKGFDVLAEAWRQVERQAPGARLEIIGTGELESVAEELVARDPSVSLRISPGRDVIHDALARAQVLVLPSQPHPSWREQVGLPIVEGLAAGCTVVTTAETGLAAWLEQHGHVVLDAPTSPEDVASGVVRALEAARSAAEVIADLPAVDGRMQADEWLMGDDSPG